MNIGVPILSGMVGFLIVYLSQATIPPEYAPYLSLAALAGLDGVCGGARAGLEGKYDDTILLTGFAMNTTLTAGLAYLGDRIGVELYLAAVVLLGGRIFTNLSLIRRYWLTQREMARRETNRSNNNA
jgi:small basic protein